MARITYDDQTAVAYKGSIVVAGVWREMPSSLR